MHLNTIKYKLIPISSAEIQITVIKILRSFIKGKTSTRAAHHTEFVDFLHLGIKIQTEVQNASFARDAKQAFFFIWEHTCPFNRAVWSHDVVAVALKIYTFSLSSCAGRLERVEESVRYDMQLKKRGISRNERKVVETGGEWRFRGSGTEGKTGSRAGGSRDERGELLYGRDGDGQDR